MVLQYLVVGSLLFCLGSAEGGNDKIYSSRNYPNPMSNFVECGRKEASYICDPHEVILKSEADQLNEELMKTVFEVRCPCSRYSCLHHDEGYKIGIALIKHKIMTDEPVDSAEHEMSESEYDNKLLHQANLFAHELLKEWPHGRCEETVIILYSSHNGVLYTAVDDVAKMKLNSSVIRDVSRHVESQFGPGGSVYKGLSKMVEAYRRVFQDTYEMNKPVAKPLRGHAVSVMKHSFTIKLLLPAFALMLYLFVGNTQ